MRCRARTHVVSALKIGGLNAIYKAVRDTCPFVLHYGSDKLDADIIAAIQLISKLDELVRSHFGIFQVVDDITDLSLGNGPVKAIGT